MSPFLSIIIPVYNVAAYLGKCLDSILELDLGQYEIILVDDGSIDDSAVICDSYASKHAHIQVFHIDNSGVSNARNFGIKHATGQWFWFVDSDDYILPETTQLVQLAKQTTSDAISFSYEEEKDNATIAIGSGGYKLGACSSKVFANTHCMTPALWSMLFKRELIEHHHLQFDAQLKFGEDRLFKILYLCLADSVTMCHHICYHYCYRVGSAVRNSVQVHSDREVSDQLSSIERLSSSSSAYSIPAELIRYQLVELSLQYIRYVAEAGININKAKQNYSDTIAHLQRFHHGEDIFTLLLETFDRLAHMSIAHQRFFTRWYERYCKLRISLS